jgi:mannose-6-phosphate isomerase-like protein (cupin superfamily)
MNDMPWRDDPLDYLIGADAAKTFFDDTYEKKALIIPRDDPERYRSLLSIARIDDMLASIDFQGDALDMARAEPPVSREQFIFPSGVADKGAVSDLYRSGATLILPQLHQTDGTLKDFTRAMEAHFSCHTQTNIYLTPPNSQGFRTHYDDHDVFVIQIEGEKTWRLYNTPIETPFRGEPFQSDVHEFGDPQEEFILKAGDCAYVPRGLVHDASTSGSGDSLHITVGLIVKTWADVMLEAVSEVALRSPGFRNSLPPGYARNNFDRTSAKAHFKKLAAMMASETDFDGAFDLFVDNFIRSRLPESGGTISGRGTPEIVGQTFRLRRFVPWRFAGDGDKVVLITAGGELTFEGGAEAGLNELLDGKTITLESFGDLSPEDAKTTLGRLFAYGVIEPAD